jgi:HlyD family secretion protein
MIVKYLLPLAALGLLGFAVYHVQHSPAWKPLSRPPVQPQEADFTPALVALGIVEAGSNNLAVAAPQPGILAEVLVQVGQVVEAGQELFRLDDRALEAEERLRAARLTTAQAQLARLEQMPRPEQLPASAARIRAAQAQLAAQKAALKQAVELFERKLLGDHELEQRRQALKAAEEQLEAAEADDRLLKSGAWEADKAVARAQVEEARALVGQIKIERQRLRVKAPIAGTVLQVNVRPGEAVPMRPDVPPVVLGNIETLHVRVDLEEQQIPRFRPNAPAQACPRGQTARKYPLKFVRIEPLVVPRRTLSGDSGERSDTRVLPVIYRLEKGAGELHVGQQMEVFIEADAEEDKGAR